MPAVASTATTPVFERRAAGLTAGSTPTKGISGCFRRKRSIAAAVAVLQATTTTSQPRAISSSAFASERRAISSAGRFP